MTDAARRPYRLNTMGVFLNKKGQVLAVERSDRPGGWQLPQGGIDEGETPQQAVVREMCEELGITPEDFSIVEQLPDTLRYDFPETLDAPIARRYRGQEQTVFILRFRQGAQPNIPASDGENRDWTWIPLSRLLPRVVSFKQEAYRQLSGLLRAYIPPDSVS